MHEEPNVTVMLRRSASGDGAAHKELMAAVYDELRRIGARYMRGESAGHTLQATALVNEAYLKLVDQRSVQWQNRGHFFAVAAQAMRRILVDHARARRADKRGGDWDQVTLSDDLPLGADGQPDVLALEHALQGLFAINERYGKVVELRYYGGLSIEETAEALGTSPATVKRDWEFARSWLYRQLSGS